MGDPRPNAADGVVAGLVTGQVHDRPKPSSVDHWRTDAIAVPRTFEHRDIDAAPTRFLPASRLPRLSHHTSFCRGSTPR